MLEEMMTENFFNITVTDRKRSGFRILTEGHSVNDKVLANRTKLFCMTVTYTEDFVTHKSNSDDYITRKACKI